MTDTPQWRAKCPVACALDVIGDKWSLLVIRDMFQGKKRYGELQSSHEGIPTNILANRLKKLVEQGVIEKRLYSEKPPRAEYHLTEKGQDLHDVIVPMFKWGAKYVEGTRQDLPEGVDPTPRM